MIHICFRFDDPSRTSNHDLERRIISTFARRDISVCAAVVPFSKVGNETLPLLPEQAEHLIDAYNKGVIEIAQHGYSHIRRGKTPNGGPSEFSSVAPEQQARLIEEGAGHLSTLFGSRMRGFVPPWNSYDLNTLQALNEAGFDYLSAAWETPCHVDELLPILPRTSWLRSVRAAIEDARCVQYLSPIVIVVLHHHDFEESGDSKASINLQKLDSLLAWIQQQDEVAPEPLSKIAQIMSDRGYLWHARYRNLRKYLPFRIYSCLPKQVLLLQPTWRMAVQAFQCARKRLR